MTQLDINGGDKALRVHNISREGECLTAYTGVKRTVLSTKLSPPGVNIPTGS